MNGWNSRSRKSSLMPEPVSVTLTWTEPLSSRWLAMVSSRRG
jgi:hypothetical protein